MSTPTLPGQLGIGHLITAIRNGRTQEFIKTAEALKTVAGTVNDLSGVVGSMQAAAAGNDPHNVIASHANNIPFNDAVTRILNEKAGDIVSILDFIPQSFHASIFNYTCTSDLSAFFSDAMANAKLIWIPAGGYGVSGLETTVVGQVLLGEGRGLVKLWKYSNNYIIKLNAGSSGLRSMSLYGNYDTFNDGFDFRPAGAPALVDTTDGVRVGDAGTNQPFSWILEDVSVLHMGRDGVNWQEGPSPIINDVFLNYNARWGMWVNQIAYMITDAWTTGVVYPTGAFVTSSGHTYVSVTSGTSGATPPSVTSGQQSDGGVTWQYQVGASDTSHGTFGKVESIRNGRSVYWEGGGFRVRGNSHVIDNLKVFDEWGNGFDLSAQTSRANLFVERIGRGNPNIASWQAATVYPAGAMVVNTQRNILYVTVTGGTSGSTNPTHTSGSASDGGVTWIYRDGIGISMSAEFYQGNELGILFMNTEDGYRTTGAYNRIYGLGTSAPPGSFSHDLLDTAVLKLSQAMAVSQQGNPFAIFETLVQQHKSGGQSTLSAGVNAVVTVIPLVSTSGFSVGNLVICGSEYMLIDSILGGNLTVQRGQMGTSAASHASGAIIVENPNVFEETGVGGASSYYDKYLGTSGGNLLRLRDGNAHLAGISVGRKFILTSSNYTLFQKQASDGDIYFIDATSGNCTFNLWDGGQYSLVGRVITIVKTDVTANVISIAQKGALLTPYSTIDADWQSRTFVLVDATAGDWVEVSKINTTDAPVGIKGNAANFPLEYIWDNTFGLGSFLDAFTTAGGNTLGFSGGEAALKSGGNRRAWYGMHQPFGVPEAFFGSPDATAIGFYANGLLRLGVDLTGLIFTIGTAGIHFGTASPEGVVAHSVGWLFVDTTNGNLYFKATGSGNTGWILISTPLTDISSGFAVVPSAANHLSIGAGGSTPNAASIIWGNGTGWLLEFGTQITGSFVPLIYFRDDGFVGFGTNSPFGTEAFRNTGGSRLEGPVELPSLTAGTKVLLMLDTTKNIIAAGSLTASRPMRSDSSSVPTTGQIDLTVSTDIKATGLSSGQILTWNGSAVAGVTGLASGNVTEITSGPSGASFVTTVTDNTATFVTSVALSGVVPPGLTLTVTTASAMTSTTAPTDTALTGFGVATHAVTNGLVTT